MTNASNAPAFQIENADGLTTLNCAVPDLKCGSCALKIEKKLTGLNGIKTVRANAASKRLYVEWTTEQNDADAIIQSLEDIGYSAQPFVEKNTKETNHKLLKPLAVSGFAMMNVMAISIAVWAGAATDMGPDTRQFLHIVSAAITLPATTYAGQVFFVPAWKSILLKQMSMDLPISLAIITTIFASLYELFHRASHVYFDAAISLVFFLLIGRVLEHYMRRRSTLASDNLRLILQMPATRIAQDGTRSQVQAKLLEIGDRVLVLPGEKIPADIILENEFGWVDESIITGETLPIRAMSGQELVAGSQVVSRAITGKVIAVDAGTRLSEIIALTEKAEAHKGEIQSLSDKFARAYGPIVIGGSIFGFLIWFFILGAGLSQSLLVGVAVLIVTCPCAAGLATPTVIIRAVNLLVDKGIIVRAPDGLERLAQVDHVIFDKTGTLTTAHLKPSAQIDHSLLEKASAMASQSTHPLSRALHDAYPTTQKIEVREIPNMGLLADNGDKLGSAVFVGANESESHAPALWFQEGAKPATQITFDETIREDAKHTIDQLMDQGLDLSLLSGDQFGAVIKVANKLGIGNFESGQAPEEKIKYIEKLHADNINALMVGDGLNDTPSLAAAHSSMTLASAVDASQAVADFILLGDKLSPIPVAIKVARQSRKLIKENLTFSLVYNIVALPIALTGALTPMIAAILMSSSSLLVMINAMRLRA